MAEKVFRFSIKAENETELFGRRHRVAIEKIAKEKGAKGSVRNLKGKAEIEIFLVAKNNEEVMKFCSDAINEIQVGLPTTISEATWLKVEQYHDFHIIREDELTEMVWALQGAGIEFSESSRKIEKIQKNLEERDEKRRVARLSSLLLELKNLKMKILLLKTNSGGFEARKPHYVALEHNIRDPADGNDDFIQSIHGVYVMTKEIEELDSRSDSHQFQSKIGEKIEPVIVQIDEAIDKISKMMEGKGLSKAKK